MAHPTLDLAVKDRQGNTPFAAALAVKDSETGQAIVQRDPKAAQQVSVVCVCKEDLPRTKLLEIYIGYNVIELHCIIFRKTC